MEKDPTKESNSETQNLHKEINPKLEEPTKHTENYCYGCEMLEKGEGGENQMTHYGGCLPHEY